MRKSRVFYLKIALFALYGSVCSCQWSHYPIEKRLCFEQIDDYPKPGLHELWIRIVKENDTIDKDYVVAPPVSNENCKDSIGECYRWDSLGNITSEYAFDYAIDFDSIYSERDTAYQCSARYEIQMAARKPISAFGDEDFDRCAVSRPDCKAEKYFLKRVIGTSPARYVFGRVGAPSDEVIIPVLFRKEEVFKELKRRGIYPLPNRRRYNENTAH